MYFYCLIFLISGYQESQLTLKKRVFNIRDNIIMNIKMKHHKYAIFYIISGVSAMSFVAANLQFNEVCDIEGSTCPDDLNCCQQSICESESIGQTENNRIQCCEEAERTKIQLPEHCSKCPKCSLKDGSNIQGAYFC